MKTQLFTLVVAFAAGCVAPKEQWSTSDEEIAQLMGRYSESTISRTREDFFKVNSLEMYSLASRLDVICKKRKVSRAAVLSSVRVNPFCNDNECVVYVLKRCGFYVEGVMFQFDGKSYVQNVRIFDATL